MNPALIAEIERAAKEELQKELRPRVAEIANKIAAEVLARTMARVQVRLSNRPETGAIEFSFIYLEQK